jgi:hypothetical protein
MTTITTWEPPVLTPTAQELANMHQRAENAYAVHVAGCKRCQQGMDCRTETDLFRRAGQAERRAINAGAPL